MTISRVYPSAWGVGEKLTSAQQNALDINVTNALDKRAAQTDTLGSIITLSGVGRFILPPAIGADADTSYVVDAANRIIWINALTADRAYTLSATGVANGDYIEVCADPALAATYGVAVKDDAAATMFTVGNGGSHDGPWASFIRVAGAWKLYQFRKRVDTPVTTFTSSGTYNVPSDVKALLLMGWGNGGSGGGGASVLAGSTDSFPGGGGGGGGAWKRVFVVEVTPGAAIAVTIPAASAGGAIGTVGNAGGDLTFGALATFLGAGPGQGGTVPLSTTLRTVYYGGAPSRKAAAVTSSTEVATAAVATNNYAGFVPVSGCGGRGMTNHAGYNLNPWATAALGMGSVDADYGTSAQGTAGADSGTSRGGGPGGGGGAGPGGVGGAGGAGGNGGGTGAAGSAGTAAATANSGAGGGGGGGAGCGSNASNGAAGGAGQTGQLVVMAIR